MVFSSPSAAVTIVTANGGKTTERNAVRIAPFDSVTRNGLSLGVWSGWKMASRRAIGGEPGAPNITFYDALLFMGGALCERRSVPWSTSLRLVCPRGYPGAAPGAFNVLSVQLFDAGCTASVVATADGVCGASALLGEEMKPLAPAPAAAAVALSGPSALLDELAAGARRCYNSSSVAGGGEVTCALLCFGGGAAPLASFNINGAPCGDAAAAGANNIAAGAFTGWALAPQGDGSVAYGSMLFAGGAACSPRAASGA